MATHSSIPAWRILWREESSGPPSLGAHRVRHDCAREAYYVHLRLQSYVYTQKARETPVWKKSTCNPAPFVI